MFFHFVKCFLEVLLIEWLLTFSLLRLKKAERRNKIKAFLLVAPLLFFLIITYVFPIGDMLMRSVDDKMVTEMLPKTFKAMEKWDGKELPEEN